MGVRHLWSLIAPAGIPISEQHLRAKRLAVDASIWLCQLESLQPARLTRVATMRILRLLHAGVRPIFVFDGCAPAEKAAALRRREMSRKWECAGASPLPTRSVLSELSCEEKHTRVAAPHDELWGPQHSSESSESSELTESSESLKTSEEASSSEFSGFHLSNSTESTETVKSVPENQPVTQKNGVKRSASRSARLRVLLALRNARKRALPTSEDSLEAFSASQITNLKDRNSVSALLRALGRQEQRIMSDHQRVLQWDSTGAPLNEEEVDSEIQRLTEVFSRPIPTGEAMGESSGSENGWDEVWQRPAGGQSAYQTGGEETESGPDKASDRTSGGVAGVDGDVEGQPGWVAEGLRMQCGSSEMPGQAALPYLLALLDGFGIPSVIAPFEADSQCARLFLDGRVDGVLTEDSDLLLYGVPTYRHYFKRSKAPMLFTGEAVKTVLGWDWHALIELSFYLGSDYTAGVSGIGPKKAVALISASHGEDERTERVREDNEELQNLKRLYSSPAGYPSERVPAAGWQINRDALWSAFLRAQLGKRAREELLYYIDRFGHPRGS